MKIKRRLMLLVLSAMMLFGCVTIAYASTEKTISSPNASVNLYGYVDFTYNKWFKDKIWYSGMMTGKEQYLIVEKSNRTSDVYVIARTDEEYVGTLYLYDGHNHKSESAVKCSGNWGILELYCDGAYERIYH